MLKNLFGKGKDAAKALEAYNKKVDEHNALVEEKDHIEHRTAENMPTEKDAEALEDLVAELDGSAAKAAEEAEAEAAKAKEGEVKADKAGKGLGAKEYKKPVAPKYNRVRSRENVTCEKVDGKWVGQGLVDFETNGKAKILGEEGKVWPTPAERAQQFVDKGLGKILGEHVPPKKEKKKK